jgi:hypothetical protein
MQCALHLSNDVAQNVASCQLPADMLQDHITMLLHPVSQSQRFIAKMTCAAGCPPVASVSTPERHLGC